MTTHCIECSNAQQTGSYPVYDVNCSDCERRMIRSVIDMGLDPETVLKGFIRGKASYESPESSTSPRPNQEPSPNPSNI